MFSHKKKTKQKQIISALFLWVLQYFVRLINLNLNLKLSIQNKYENKNKLYSNTNFNFFNQFTFLIFWQNDNIFDNDRKYKYKSRDFIPNTFFRSHRF